MIEDSHSWAKEIKSLGSTGTLALISVLLILVITGIIPSPLMKAVTRVEHIEAQQDSDTSVQERLLRVAVVTCKNQAQDKTQRDDCDRAANYPASL